MDRKNINKRERRKQRRGRERKKEKDKRTDICKVNEKLLGEIRMACKVFDGEFVLGRLGC